ncbi:hypothetical protein EKO27_g10510 [Xylaria grammica]|uniref:Uncharacterized protein n=1 Tax=Xylaria grammica TaxID=363999 RepID=A0A439CQZ9_9PEZI|nr:hypothetical protein EKO27_g10510 [Xylaria grammica]
MVSERPLRRGPDAVKGTAEDDAKQNNDDRDRSVSGVNEAINHPQFKGFYNFEGRKSNQLKPTEKRALEMTVHYPNVRKGIMKAPLLFRTESFTKPTARQPEGFTKVLGTPEIFNKISDHIKPCYMDLVNLCRTSQFAAGRVQSIWMHLDATKNDFLGWDQETLGTVRKREDEEEERCERAGPQGAGSSKGNGVKRAFFSSSIIVSPIRPQEQGPSRDMVVNKAGYPVTSSVEEAEKTSLTDSMRANYKLLHMAYLNGYAIKHLILHGMPWVVTEMIQCIVQHMPALETLGIHQCFLMTLGDTQPLLRVIININKEREERKQPHIALDFTPFYYRGPPYKPDGTGHVGEYGIVPEEVEWLCSTQAVAAQLLGIRDLCQEGGQDFFTAGTGFRSFLDRLPVRTMGFILECIENIHNYKMTGVSWPSSCVSSAPPTSEEDKAVCEKETALWQDFIIACNGQPMFESNLDRVLMEHGRPKLSWCSECQTHMPAYFFTSDELRRPQGDQICHGCQLQMALTRHKWRSYKERRAIATRIFKNKSSLRLYSLAKVLKHINKPETPAVEPTSTQPGKTAKPAIIARPGMADSEFLELAEQVEIRHKYDIPDAIKVIDYAIQMIDWEYESLSYEEREKKAKEREDLVKERLKLEFELGTNQRDISGQNGSLERECRSWELNIRDYRAELCIERGEFVNNGPMMIFNLEKNVSSMLGHSGGFHEYWNDDTETESNDDESTKADSSQDYCDCPMTPTNSIAEPQNQELEISSFNTYSGDEDSTARRNSGSSLATTVSAKESCAGTPRNQKRASSLASPPPAPRKRTPRRYVTPAIPVRKLVLEPASQAGVPRQTPLRRASARTSARQQPANTAIQLPPPPPPPPPSPQNTFPQKQGDQTEQAVSESEKCLLPHQRRGKQAARPTQATSQQEGAYASAVSPENNTFPHTPVTTAEQETQVAAPRKRPAQVVAQPQRLLPPQWLGKQAAQPPHAAPEQVTTDVSAALSGKNASPHTPATTAEQDIRIAAPRKQPAQRLLPHQWPRKQALQLLQATSQQKQTRTSADSSGNDTLPQTPITAAEQEMQAAAPRKQPARPLPLTPATATEQETQAVAPHKQPTRLLPLTPAVKGEQEMQVAAPRKQPSCPLPLTPATAAEQGVQIEAPRKQPAKHLLPHQWLAVQPLQVVPRQNGTDTPAESCEDNTFPETPVATAQETQVAAPRKQPARLLPLTPATTTEQETQVVAPHKQPARLLPLTPAPTAEEEMQIAAPRKQPAQGLLPHQWPRKQAAPPQKRTYASVAPSENPQTPAPTSDQTAQNPPPPKRAARVVPQIILPHQQTTYAAAVGLSQSRLSYRPKGPQSQS